MMPESYQHPLVYIINGEWEREGAVDIVPHIEKWEVQKLRVANNKRTALLRDIAHISFPLLTELLVYGNFLDSIEGIARTYLPCIQELDAHCNNIYSVRMLRKTNWPHLSTINFSRNKFVDSDTLVQASFPKLSIIRLRWTYSLKDEDTNQFADPCFPAKFSIPLKQLQNKTYKFSGKRSVKRVLQQKWKQATLQ